MELSHDPGVGTFFVEDKGQGSGTFIKVVKDHKLTSDSIIVVGNSSIRVKKSAEGHLELEFYDGPIKGTKKKLDPATKSKFTLGRANDCDIPFVDDGLSRVQTSFEFKENEWVVHDSDGKKESMNGTWMLVDRPILLSKDIFLKVGSTLFEVKIKK
eukprot:TRINITY_DN2120_c0_g1_i3.p1 TRINITY_DN2120_c0_g1~~TRINITY_DN2120_c0_g1_i3.p1  ORF type:complete len:156 (-),score=36.17 TRINITY_DN2120_c0_g1_i3:36-503(-)